MAKKHFLFSSRLIRKAPFLRLLSWVVEAIIVRSLAVLMRSMSPERATRFSHSMFRCLKPILPFTAKIRRNLTIAFPDRDSDEIEHLTSDVCGNLGDTAAELILADRIWTERDERIEFVIAEGIDLTQ
jgi:lauroyl/myristoyl acyltransferase